MIILTLTLAIWELFLILVTFSAFACAMGVVCSLHFLKSRLMKKHQRTISEIKENENKAKQIIIEAEQATKATMKTLKDELYQDLELRKKNNLDYENMLLKRSQKLSDREHNLDEKLQETYKEQKELKQLKLEYQKKIQEQESKLEIISGTTKEEAKTLLLTNLENELKTEFNKVVKTHEYNTRLQSKEIANNIIAQALERYATNMAVDKSVSYVKLPNEEMKGRVIGKEGRNIRAFEMIAGVDIIIDDTPEIIQVSSFNPIRREIATRALTDLVKDGRIHPIKIEELIKFHEQEIDEHFKVDGQEILDELKIINVHPKLVEYLGRLKYRTSFGQNVLLHSFEVGKLSGLIASELGLDIKLATRAGLLHDIGKSVDFELEGSHVYNGVILAKKYHENNIVINAIHSHHGEVPKDNIYSCIVSAADTLSAARTGARNNSLEAFVTRIKEIEDLCKSMQGVQKAYAVQAGRQIRVFVDPEVLSDHDTYILARDLKTKLKSFITIPGDIYITVIRELKATELII